MPDKYHFLYKIPSNISNGEYHHNKNIVKASARIFKKFRKYNEVVAISEMQAGKTELMKRIIYIIRNYNSHLRNMDIEIDKYNIYVVLCASSRDLKHQLKEKLPEIKRKIYHLNDIMKYLKNSYEYECDLIPMADSSLIIFDESHCDAETNKIMDKFRKIIDKLAKENKTKFFKLSCSATPYEQIMSDYPKVIMKPGSNYYGIRDMFRSLDPVVIFPSKKLEDESECNALFTEIKICNYYYIFRLPGNISAQNLMVDNIEKQFKKQHMNIDVHFYTMDYGSNINDLIKTKPSKPTIIYLKDKLRMGEFLDTKYVYVVHDTPESTHTHTTVQSLVGRCCGYNKKSHQTIIYCDYEKVLQHHKWVKHGYAKKYIPIDAKYINKRTRETKDICIY